VKAVAVVVLAAVAVVAAVVIVRSGDGCDDLRFDRPEWTVLGRDDYADCVAERQPFRGLDREALALRLGPPEERYGRRKLIWWIGPDDTFGMHVDTLEIPLDDRGRAGPAEVIRRG
jgi:hypothetical protein